MKIGIVIVNYNNVDDTLACISSLIKLPENKNIIIVDNASQDDSVSILEKKDTIVLLKSKENKGFAAGCNIGFSKAIELECDYVWYLNNDAVAAEPNTISQMIKKSEEYNNNCLVGALTHKTSTGEIECIGGGVYSKIGYCRPITQFENLDKLNYISGCSLFGHIKVFKKIGKWDEDYFLYWEDTDYSFRARQKGIELVIANTKVFHKGSASTGKFIVSKYYYANRNNILFFKKRFNFFVVPALFVLVRIFRYLLKLEIKRAYGGIRGLFSGLSYCFSS